jgi:hypothetical protein
MVTLTELRQQFEDSPVCQFVSPEVYIERLTGHEPLIRADEPSANLLGLLNQTTGRRIFVPVEDFLSRDGFELANGHRLVNEALSSK